MATTYTTNYKLGKQEEKSDKFSIDVINNNADIIDIALKENADAISEEVARAQRAEELLQKDTFGVPEGRVTSGSNMDDYTTNGAFLCLSSAVGKTLINCPVEAGFRLEVKALAAGTERCVQILYPNINNDVIFYSRRLLSIGWTDWYALTGVIAPVINTVTSAAETEEI